ncbi:hypothetical protein WR25_15477 isoform C [Diploscapter pachys]|uniref:General transcription factor IIH subunit 3 n=2 Tax=Diploscapter pachys TaxID=2018661 RepID=A0A2A2J3X1_9BILA|nr:hypothetical protein WR25_15477 isoform A [Diploscapter pachys]PAV56363.1 hypothetical protein WR25_15477 isoform C [Diploscapter pachys]
MYVVDSIIKNVQPSEYRELFEKIIIKLFLHVFKEGDERVRSSLYKLRCTWPNIFIPSKLYQLDMKVNMEDNNWPIVNPKRPGPPLPGMSQPPSSSAPSVSSARPPARSSASADHANQQHQVPTTRVYVNPNFIAQQGDSAGTAQGSATASSKDNGVAPATANPRDPRQNRAGKAEDKKEKKGRKAETSELGGGNKKELIDELLSSPHPLEKMGGGSPEPPPKMARIEKPSANAQFGPEPPPSAAAVVKNLTKSATTTSTQQSGGKKALLVAPNTANSAPSTSTAKGSNKRRSNELQQSGKEFGGGDKKKSFKQQQHGHGTKDTDMRSENKSPVQMTVHKTAELGSHAFVNPSSAANPSQQQQQKVQQTITKTPLLSTNPTMPPNVLAQMVLQPPPLSAVSTQPATSLSAPSSHLQSTVSMPTPVTHSHAPHPHISTLFPPPANPIHQPPSIPISTIATAGFIGHSPFAPAPGLFLPNLSANPLLNLGNPLNLGLLPPAAFIPTVNVTNPNLLISNPQLRPPPVITSDTVKLEGIPANNRIFVDGKAHEVIYVDNTAVIERNGLPHRIYFSGPPRDILIDGERMMMKFGETKTVFIDGQPHQLRFGAPSRELYMGDFPFKGQFGGPPIIAHINGIRHEIRLTGTAPEVKIEPEPAYDLARFLNKMREERQQPVMEQPKQKPDDLTQLLTRLKQSGALKLPVETVKGRESGRERSPAAQAPYGNDLKSVKRIQFFDHSAYFSLGSLERRNIPNVSFKDFNARSMATLRIYFDSVIEDLLTKRHDVCTYCGLRMEPQGEKWNRHMDWHVQQNLNKVADTARQRKWFKPVEEIFKECEEGEKMEEELDKTVKKTVKPSTIGSSTTDNKECAVCGEKFDEYFDEEHDEWRFRNAVVINNTAYHKGCAADATIHQGEDGEGNMEPEINSNSPSQANTSFCRMTNLALLVETSALSWGKLGEEQGRDSLADVFRAVTSFSNAYISMASSNRLQLFGFAKGLQKKLLYDSGNSDSLDTSQTIVDELRSALRTSAESDDLTVGAALAPTVAQAMCCWRRFHFSSQSTSALTNGDPDEATTSAFVPVNDDSTARGRILIVAMTVEFGHEHSALMNLFFAAAKQDICVDVIVLGDNSPLLQQAADITGGLYISIDHPKFLVSKMLNHALFPAESRNLFPQPVLTNVDYRASCVCHNELVSSGWVCSVCLSVLCQFMPICRACKYVLSNILYFPAF